MMGHVQISADTHALGLDLKLQSSSATVMHLQDATHLNQKAEV